MPAICPLRSYMLPGTIACRASYVVVRMKCWPGFRVFTSVRGLAN